MSVPPRSLAMRPFTPALPDVVIMAGLPADRPNAHAVTFTRLLREVAERIKSRAKSIV